MRPLVALAVLVLGCDEEVSAPREHIAEPEAPGLASAPERGAAGTDGCVDRLRRATPPELASALGGLGWRTVYEDACASEAARTSGDAAACDALSLRALRAPCRERVAIASGTPASCPETSDAHDALCVALAARRPSLCRAVPLARRAACEAILGTRAHPEPDSSRCEDHDVPDSETCAEIVTGLGPLVPEMRTDGGRTELTVHLRTQLSVTLGSGRSPAPVEEEELGERELGATLRWEGCARVIEVGSPDADPLARRTRYHVRARLVGEPPWTVAAGEGAEVTVFRTSFGEASAGPVVSGRADVRVETLEPEIGGRLDLRVTGALARSPGEVEVTLDVRTILRDVIGAPDEGCEEP